MAGRTITIPAWTANLLPNVFGLLGLSTICVMLGFLTDWRWGGLAAGIFATVLAVWIQLTAPATASVTPPKKAS